MFMKIVYVYKKEGGWVLSTKGMMGVGVEGCEVVVAERALHFSRKT